MTFPSESEYPGESSFIAGYTYRELQDEVIIHQFSDQKYRPLVRTWLNQAQRRVVLESNLRTQDESATVTTEVGKSAYSLPSDFARIIDLHNPTTQELLTPIDIKSLDALPASTGLPYSYVISGTNILLYPTPDAVYSLSLRYWRLPEDMVSDSDTPEVPAQYQELLIAFAMKKAFLREDDPQMAQTWEVQFEKGMLKLRGEANDDTFDGPRQVGGTWGDEHGGALVNSWWR
ncbi:MAG: hypothetical protein JSS68_15005 [Actinobacteria bacterium]|nr:hypothetical protein [Actinomycetota bacterium]